MDEQNVDNVILDDWYNTIPVSVGQYEFFMANGKDGMDALLVLMHLIYTGRRQQTNQVWASVSYIRKGLSMGADRLKRAKSFLHEHGFIEYIQNRDEQTKQVGKTYIKVVYMPKKAGGLKSRPPVNRTTGNGQEMLKENNTNALNEQQTQESVDVLNVDVLKRIQPEVTETKQSKDAVNTLKEDFEGREDDIPAYLHYVNTIAAEKANNNIPAYFVNAINGRWFFAAWEDASKTEAEHKKEATECPVCGKNIYDKRCGSCSYLIGDDVEKHKEIVHRKKVLAEDPESEEAILIRIKAAEHFMHLHKQTGWGNVADDEKKLKELYTKLQAFEKYKDGVPVF